MDGRPGAASAKYHNVTSHTAASSARPLRIALVDTIAIIGNTPRMFNLEVIAGDIVGYSGETGGELVTHRGMPTFLSRSVEIYFVLLHRADTPETALAKLDYIQPDITGISMKINTLGNTRPILSHVLHKKWIAICGNSQSELAHDELLREFPDAIMVTNEGEAAVRGIIDAVRLLWAQTAAPCALDIGKLKALLRERRIPNVAFQESGATYVADQKRFDLGHSYPPLRVTYRLSEFAKLEEAVDFEFNRGCSHSRCSFCAIAHWRSSCGGNIRHYHRPIQQVIADLRRGHACGARVFNCVSEDFIPDPDESEELQAVDEFIEALIQLRREGIVLHFFFAARVRAVFAEGDDQCNAARLQRFEKLREAGCVLVYLGIESGNEEQLKRYGKDNSVHESACALCILNRLGYTVAEGMIMFDPLMINPREILANIEFMRRLDSMNGPHQRSTVLNRCRVRAHSGLARWIRLIEREQKVVMLGPLDIDKLEYPVLNYVNPDIFAVVQQTLNWQAQGDNLMSVIRDLLRRGFIAKEATALMQGESEKTSVSAPVVCFQYVGKYYRGLRRLELDLLEELTSAIMHRAHDPRECVLSAILFKYRAIRFAVLLDLEKTIHFSDFQTETTRRLSVLIQQLCADYPEDVARSKSVDGARVASYAGDLCMAN